MATYNLAYVLLSSVAHLCALQGMVFRSPTLIAWYWTCHPSRGEGTHESQFTREFLPRNLLILIGRKNGRKSAVHLALIPTAECPMHTSCRMLFLGRPFAMISAGGGGQGVTVTTGPPAHTIALRGVRGIVFACRGVRTSLLGATFTDMTIMDGLPSSPEGLDGRRGRVA